MPRYKAHKKTSLPPLPTKPDVRERYDWSGARQDYINGVTDADGTLVYPKNIELSEKYNIPVQSLANKVHKERWNDHRQANERARAIQIQKDRTKLLAKKAVIFDETAADAASTAMKIIADRLFMIDKINQKDLARQAALLEIEETEGVEAQYDELRPRWTFAEVSELSKAFANFHEAGRRALGIKDDESGVNNTQIVNVEITQNITDELKRDDETRQKALMSVLMNPNLVLPGVTTPAKTEEDPEVTQLAITSGEDEEEIHDAELV